MAMTDTCARCGKTWPISQLDAKPERLAGDLATVEAISAAMDTGEDFDRLECVNCYGPAFTPGNE